MQGEVENPDTSYSCSLSKLAEDLFMLGKPVHFLLGKNEIVIHDHVEHPALSLDQLSLDPELF